MAADQRRKRSNGASMVSCGYPEQHRTKRKNLGLVRSDLAMKSHVSVEWDGNQQRVVAKREQIGISWRQMRPFANIVPNGHKILADVLAIPQEIFGMDNLNEVISYEVWNTHLSDDERNLLMQFLPSDLEPHQVVQELLSGDNFHFGNSFMKWGASLCSGDLHPDTIVNQEQHLKSDKRAYYSQLHDYHNDMIGFLMKLKRRWESCKDSEKEIVEKTWRVLDKGFNKGKPKNLMVSSDHMHNVGARPKKGDKLHKLNIHSSDGDKYMSYIKISKTQHELVKSMKLSCNRIQYRTLNHVLGDLDNIHVQPYEVFIKEEQKKLHEHWLQLVNKDLPAAYANWKERLIQKHAMINSLLVEMKDKSKPLVEDKDIVSSGIQPQDQEEDGSLNDQSSLEDDEDSIARSPENHSLHNSYHSGDDELNHLSMDSENIILPKSDDASQNKSEFSRIMNSQDVPISEGAPFSSDCHAWQAVKMPHSYYDSAVTHEYTANGLSLINPQVDEEQPTRLISLDSDLHQEDTGKELLHRQSNDDSFSSYPSQDRIDLLQSLFKGKGVKSYHHEQERVFQTSNNVMMGDGQLFSHFKEPSQTPLTLDQGQRRSSEVFIPENMSDNIYSDGGRYLMPRQDPLSAVSITDWAANAPPPMVAPSQSHVNTGDFIGQHWLSAEHQVRGGWNGGSDGGTLSSQSLGTGGNSDQSLFSILSHCSQLRSGSPYESVRHSDQFLAPRTLGVVDAGTPRINAVVSPSSHPLDYFSGREAPNALVPDDMAWMSLQPQNPALHDQMGKPYLRSWNR